jgi:NOL1/NOP2/sun family putative RNA methylase
MLPQEFQDRMQQMLGEEYPAFLESYDTPRAQALRVNPLKGSVEEFQKKAPFALEPVVWEPCGFYYDREDAPGKHPYHEAGVYYIQESSAMAPAAYLDAQLGEKILDLCAAPGGKSTQIAAAMRGEGLLISNEIHPARAKILSENIERMGIRNCLVTNESPQSLAGIFEAYFDRIMVDAPCSGEGMFRKNEQACDEWSTDNVALCAERQQEILECAASMLRPGGRIVYSTCTFAPEENEGTVSRFIEKHPEFSICEVRRYEGMSSGMPAWVRKPVTGLERTIRLFPHKLRGEGHFLAVLHKEGSVPEHYSGYCANGVEKGIAAQEAKEYFAFQKEFLAEELSGKLIRFGEQLYLVPDELPALKKLKVLRAGLHLGTLKKNRFEPAHALALALSPQEVHKSWNIPADGQEIRAYLSGQTFPAESDKGWYLITVDGYSVGWGKLAGGIMKNHYPKGLRIHYEKG